jgi:quercetin dioxygenase-like cupin family protein
MLETEFMDEMQDAGLAVSVWSNEPGETYAAHSHDYKKILCCLRGSIVFHTDKGDVTLKAGDRVVLEAGTLHSATVGPEGTRCAEAQVPI